MEVTIKPHHLRDNSWTHGAGGLRRCPLEEALKEQGYKRVIVGKNFTLCEGYEFLNPPDWNRESVERLIRNANDGSEEEYTLILNPE